MSAGDGYKVVSQIQLTMYDPQANESVRGFLIRFSDDVTGTVAETFVRDRDYPAQARPQILAVLEAIRSVHSGE